MQTHFEVLDSKIVCGLKKIINGDFKKRSLFKKKLHRKKNVLSRDGNSDG